MNNSHLASGIAKVLEEELPGIKQMEAVRMLAKELGVKKHILHNLVAGVVDEAALTAFCHYFELDKPSLLAGKKIAAKKTASNEEA